MYSQLHGLPVLSNWQHLNIWHPVQYEIGVFLLIRRRRSQKCLDCMSLQRLVRESQRVRLVLSPCFDFSKESAICHVQRYYSSVVAVVLTCIGIWLLEICTPFCLQVVGRAGRSSGWLIFKWPVHFRLIPARHPHTQHKPSAPGLGVLLRSPNTAPVSQGQLLMITS